MEITDKEIKETGRIMYEYIENINREKLYKGIRQIRAEKYRHISAEKYNSPNKRLIRAFY